jgi:two-component system sensor histidine kinase RegB
MRNSILLSPSSRLSDSLNFAISRLTILRTVIASLLLVFLVYLELNHFAPAVPSWFILSVYLPLLIVGLIQGRRGLSANAFALHLFIETQLITLFLYFMGGAGNPLISYLLVLIVIAAYNLKKMWVWFIALTCIIDYTLLTQYYIPIEFSLSSHHLSSSSSNQGYLIYWHLAGMWLTFIISAIALSLIIPALMQASLKKRSQLIELREKQLKNEQLIGIATLAAGTAHEMGTPLMTMEMILNDNLEQNIQLTLEDCKLLHQQVMICRQSLKRLSLAGRDTHHSNSKVQFIVAEQWINTLLHRWRLSQPNALWKHLNSDKISSKNDHTVRKSPLLDQAILNLLDNAAQAGRETIELSSNVIDGFWQLSIHQPDLLASKQLKQDPSFSSDKEFGLGLGLYLSNASIEQFNGEVHLSANKDGSTTCVVSLPCHTVGNLKEY